MYFMASYKTYFFDTAALKSEMSSHICLSFISVGKQK